MTEKPQYKMERRIDLANINKIKPMEGDVYYDVEITGFGDKGDPVARLSNGQVVIIKKEGLKVRQKVDIIITVTKDRFVFAKLYE